MQPVLYAGTFPLKELHALLVYHRRRHWKPYITVKGQDWILLRSTFPADSDYSASIRLMSEKPTWGSGPMLPFQAWHGILQDLTTGSNEVLSKWQQNILPPFTGSGRQKFLLEGRTVWLTSFTAVVSSKPDGPYDGLVHLMISKSITGKTLVNTNGHLSEPACLGRIKCGCSPYNEGGRSGHFRH